MNLAINACDAMPQGGALTARTDGYLLIEVIDTGIGMDADTATHVFDPFFTTKAEGGTGLGDAVVYGIVREHGGTIAIETTPGRATTMRILLPAAVAPAEPESPAPSATEAAPHAQATILVVDDLDPLRQVCAAILRRAGYAVFEAAGGYAALQIADQYGGMDLVILDSSMPGLSGRQTFDAMRQRFPDLKVVFVSGYAADTLQGLQADPHWTFLQKPFDGPALLQAVRRGLEGPSA